MVEHRALTLNDIRRLQENEQVVENADLGAIDWSNCDLPDLKLKNCLIQNGDFSQSQLEGLIADQCRFLDCSFRSANLDHSHFKGCRFVNKETHEGCSFRFSEMKNATIEECDLSFVRFHRCDLYDLTVTDTMMRAVDFSESTFARVLSKTRQLVRLEVKDSNFERANLRGLNLSSMQAERSKFAYALMEECDLSGALLLECDLGNAELLSAILNDANLSGSNLHGLDLRSLKSFSGLLIMESQQKQLLKEMGVEVI
jgi:fluoroquinolone resistance protein